MTSLSAPGNMDTLKDHIQTFVVFEVVLSVKIVDPILSFGSVQSLAQKNIVVQLLPTSCACGPYCHIFVGPTLNSNFILYPVPVFLLPFPYCLFGIISVSPRSLCNSNPVRIIGLCLYINVTEYKTCDAFFASCLCQKSAKVSDEYFYISVFTSTCPKTALSPFYTLASCHYALTDKGSIVAAAR